MTGCGRFNLFSDELEAGDEWVPPGYPNGSGVDEAIGGDEDRRARVRARGRRASLPLPLPPRRSRSGWSLIAGTPTLRTPDGEQPLRAGDVVCFPGSTEGAHTVHGPGRVLMLSDEVWPAVVVYPDSDKVGARPGPSGTHTRDAAQLPARRTRRLLGRRAVRPVANLLRRRDDARRRRPGRLRDAVRADRAVVGGSALGASVYVLDEGQSVARTTTSPTRSGCSCSRAGRVRTPEGEEEVEAGDIGLLPGGPEARTRRPTVGRERAHRDLSTKSSRPMRLPDSDKVGIWPPGKLFRWRRRRLLGRGARE
jgi:hypothetical protein